MQSFGGFTRSFNPDGYVTEIDAETIRNTHFRRVLFTTERSQLVLMHLDPHEDIGEETHPDNDQFIRCEKGDGLVTLEDKSYPFQSGDSVTIPAGTYHNIENTSAHPMKLYTIYSPPHHKDGVEFATKAQAEASAEKFDGVTTKDREQLR
jgi:mannose-6-phosphate isomerase-like protein (cupin superfamily)